MIKSTASIITMMPRHARPPKRGMVARRRRGDTNVAARDIGTLTPPLREGQQRARAWRPNAAWFAAKGCRALNGIATPPGSAMKNNDMPLPAAAFSA
ncbi:MAG: hypothetical protein AB1586_33475 [Pseudomonadota bacterium]|jgi:hypothetical protein